MKRMSQQPRSGAVTVEFAFTAGLAFFLVFSLIIGALGVFRYQEVAHLAREGARFASTHGGKYVEDGMPQSTGVAAISSSSDMRTYLLSRCVLLDPNKLTVSVSWSLPKISPANYPFPMDTTTTNPPAQTVLRNFVTVTVTYDWKPELFISKTIKLTSTSTMAMRY